MVCAGLKRQGGKRRSTVHVPPNIYCLRSVHNDQSCKCISCRVSVVETGIMLSRFLKVSIAVAMLC